MARKILIVDDQEDILLILEREFRRAAGFSVSSATKFADALSLVSKKGIDLIISDVRLGRESGFDLVREVNRAHPGVGSILMSAYRSSSNRQQAEDLGVVLFLEKPFQVSQLIEEVENYFQRRENPVVPVEDAPPEPEPVPAESQTESAGLVHFKLQDLVQLFCLNGRNILITAEPEEGHRAGEIYIQRGRVIHADFDGKAGEEAFHALMQFPNLQLKVRDWIAPVPVTIESSWEHLLLQSAVYFDQMESHDLSSDRGQSLPGLLG